MRKRSLWALAVLPALLVAVACGGGEAPAPPPTAEPAAPAAGAGATGTASIAGVVLYTGTEDPDTEISMDADPNCLALHDEPVETERVVTDGEGHLANVFVHVTEGISGSYPAPSDSVVLNQMGCQYTPHVFGIQVGQTLVVKNSDETLHNIHATPDTNPEFNQGQPFQGMELERTFDEVELMVPFKCDVHPWMSAYAGVLDHPFFAVSGADGSFAIGDLPAGTYTVEAWHEEFGTRTAEVTVGDGESAAVSFDFTG